jgi:phage tail-like protein
VSSPESQTYLGGDPTLSSRFLFEVDGIEIGLFASVSGLEVTSTTDDVVEGGQNGYVHRLPGRFQWPNIVFSRGLTKSDALFEWMNKTAGEGFATAGHKVTRSTGAITVIAGDGSRLLSWSLDDVLPVRWKGPSFDVGTGSPLSEELEITHHGFRSAAAGGTG